VTEGVLVVEKPAGGEDVALSAKAFREQIDRYILAQPFWTGSEVRSEPGLLWRMRDLMVSAPKHLSGSAVPDSRSPASIGAISWFAVVDREVRRFGPGGSTAEILAAAGAADYGPDRVPQLKDWTNLLFGWAREAVALLGESRPPVPLRRPCPRCGCQFAHRQSGSESLRVWSLCVDVASGHASCLGCGAEYQDLAWLARLLDGAPAGVVD
jgi:hypothetical protein